MLLLLSPRGGGSNYQGQDVNPGSVAPQSKPWTVRPRRLVIAAPQRGQLAFGSQGHALSSSLEEQD